MPGSEQERAWIAGRAPPGMPHQWGGRRSPHNPSWNINPEHFCKGFCHPESKASWKKTPGIRTRVRMSIHSAATPGLFQPCFPRYRAKSIEIP